VDTKDGKMKIEKDINLKHEKASEFISRHTKQLDGKDYIDAVGAIIELYSRIMASNNETKNIYEAIGDVCTWGDKIEVEERVNKLEGNKKIEIISEDQAKSILKG
jgi:hypothetical protein